MFGNACSIDTIELPKELFGRFRPGAAIRGASVYQLSWHDAHMWAYAECFGLGDLFSEDFQHGRIYGTVRTTNPFI